MQEILNVILVLDFECWSVLAPVSKLPSDLVETVTNYEHRFDRLLVSATARFCARSI
jgi:hypothetical protein